MTRLLLSLLLATLSSQSNAFLGETSSLRPLTTAPRTLGRSQTPPSLTQRSATNFFDSIFAPKKTVQVKKPKFETVVIDPDFRVATLFLSIGVLLDTLPYLALGLGPLVTLLGVLFLVQTFRIRFRFDSDGYFELLSSSKGEDNLQSTGENVVVGGANKWATDTIVNYDFFPKGGLFDTETGLIGPILVYFKETQTPSDSWNEGPGKTANDPEKIATGKAVPGQVHFFPAVCNGKQIRAEFAKRGCGKIE